MDVKKTGDWDRVCEAFKQLSISFSKATDGINKISEAFEKIGKGRRCLVVGESLYPLEYLGGRKDDNYGPL